MWTLPQLIWIIHTLPLRGSRSFQTKVIQRLNPDSKYSRWVGWWYDIRIGQNLKKIARPDRCLNLGWMQDLIACHLNLAGKTNHAGRTRLGAREETSMTRAASTGDRDSGISILTICPYFCLIAVARPVQHQMLTRSGGSRSGNRGTLVALDIVNCKFRRFKAMNDFLCYYSESPFVVRSDICDLVLVLHHRCCYSHNRVIIHGVLRLGSSASNIAPPLFLRMVR
jgi:hypothetical protein